MGRLARIVVSGIFAFGTLSASAQPLTLEQRLEAWSERMAVWLEELMPWRRGDRFRGLDLDKEMPAADPDGRRIGPGDTNDGG
jgi:hypothetical protein